jgi:hypothetical protein
MSLDRTGWWFESMPASQLVFGCEMKQIRVKSQPNLLLPAD